MATIFGRQGIPGAMEQEMPSEEMQAMLLKRAEGQQIIGQDDIRKAADILQKYKSGKAALEQRVVEDELWWELRHWEAIRSAKQADAPKPTSAWLFNSIINKHADAMDNYPEPIVLPREESDRDSAKLLSEVLPVLMECNGFDDVYSDAWWEKLKHGTAPYGVFWDPQKENGLGDITIKQIDLLKLFWEPGVTDIQESRNLFIVELVDTDILDEQFPEFKGKLKGGVIDVAEYQHDESIDTSDKSVVVDWYYKVKAANGQTLVHYAKFVGDCLLYASENDPEYRERGYYDHGLYPVVMDVMFPEKGTPCGFGYVAICKDPQLYIDNLSGNILENAMMGTKKRFFVSGSTTVNKEQFLNWNEPLVEVEGELGTERLREIETRPLDGVYVSVLQQKVEEMKETAANRDVNNGGASSQLTAAAAIAALQEAGNKVSRDVIAASYRSYTKIVQMCIELVRQFYDESRSFRIAAPNAPDGYEFVSMDNSGLQDQVVGMDSFGEAMYRRPVFDLKIKAQKQNPFSVMEQNERAKELYGMGFFDPARAQEALMALEMMSFEGIEQIKQKVQQGQTLYNMLMQMQQQMSMMMGVPMEAGTAPAPTGEPQSEQSLAQGVMEAQTPMTGYGERLAERSKPSL